MSLAMIFVTLLAFSTAQRLGSREASQAAADTFLELLKPLNGCLEAPAALPNSESKNLAALWLRAAFHAAGTWKPQDGAKGGLDNSLVSFANDSANFGLDDALPHKFIKNPSIQMSQADMIALAGTVSVGHCGGPRIKFNPGRLDTNQPAGPGDRLPMVFSSYANIKARLYEMVCYVITRRFFAQTSIPHFIWIYILMIGME